MGDLAFWNAFHLIHNRAKQQNLNVCSSCAADGILQSTGHTEQTFVALSVHIGVGMSWDMWLAVAWWHRLWQPNREPVSVSFGRDVCCDLGWLLNSLKMKMNVKKADWPETNQHFWGCCGRNRKSLLMLQSVLKNHRGRLRRNWIIWVPAPGFLHWQHLFLKGLLLGTHYSKEPHLV